MEKIFNKLFLLLGFFCTMNAVAIKIAGLSFAVYNVIIMLLLALQLYQNLQKKHILFYLSANYALWYAFFMGMIFSVIVACFTTTDVWINNSIFLTGKFLVFILGMLLLFNNEELVKYRRWFFKGLFYSAIAQLIWGILQLIFWYEFSNNINQTVFGDFLGIGGADINWDANIMGGVICRMSGFSWEPANFALIMLVGWILSSSVQAKAMFILALIFSTSKTGFLCLLLLFIIMSIRKIKSANYFIDTLFSWKGIFYTGLLIFVFSVSIIIFQDIFLTFIDTFSDMWNNLLISIMTDGNDSANVHKTYYTELFKVWDLSSLMNIIFGYGTFSAGYPYALNNIIPYDIVSTWNPESDFITLFVGNGIFGGLLYYGLLIDVYRKTSLNGKYMVMVIAMAGITYLFFRGTWTSLILLFLSAKSLEK